MYKQVTNKINANNGKIWWVKERPYLSLDLSWLTTQSIFSVLETLKSSLFFSFFPNLLYFHQTQIISWVGRRLHWAPSTRSKRAMQIIWVTWAVRFIVSWTCYGWFAAVFVNAAHWSHTVRSCNQMLEGCWGLWPSSHTWLRIQSSTAALLHTWRPLTMQTVRNISEYIFSALF